jgi:hypothetical protein
MTKAYNNSLLARNISISGVNTNISGILQLNDINVSVSGHTHTSSNITDFNTTVSGLLPVKNILAGNNITISSSSGTYTINSAGGGGSSSTTVRGNVITSNRLSSFNVSGGYSVGYLDIFQNGVKLLSGSDFTATDGTSVTLSNSVPSGTVLEYISLEASVSSSNYTKLDNISSSFNGSSTSFGLAVSGIAYYPVSANTLGIYVGGVAQEPLLSYSVSGSNIVFTEAPASGLTFWGVGYGTTAVATLNGIVPGSVSAPAISLSNDLSTGFYSPSSGSLAIASSGYDRFKIDNKGDIFVGGENINSLRYLDINNINSGSNAGSILRLITSNVSGTSNVSADFIKYKNGQFSINNSETNSDAFTSFNVGNSERLRITSSGNIGIGTTVPTTLLDINHDKFRVRNSKTPASSSDIGNTGDICWDSNYIYVCTNTNRWTRSPISAWSSDPYFSNVSLLLHMNGTGSSFVDSSASPKIITAFGSASQSAVQSKWGGTSLLIDSASKYLSLSSSGFSMSGDFVMECWVYMIGSASSYVIMEARSDTNAYQDYVWYLDRGGYNGFVTVSSGARLDGTTALVPQNQWTHIAIVRSSNIISAYVNGIRDNTTSSYAGTITPANSVITIGSNGFQGFNGYIDDLRVTIGSNRGYTGSTITVPTAAFPDYNT